jgi:predicted transcriptional regulator
MKTNSSTAAPAPCAVNADQLVIDVLKFMISKDQYKVPVYDKQDCLGLISFEDIIKFLTRANESALLYHKMNYEMRALLS